MSTPRALASSVASILCALLAASCAPTGKEAGTQNSGSDAGDGSATDGGEGSGTGGTDGDTGADGKGEDGGDGGGTDGGGGDGCRATAPNPDRDRVVLVSLPYDADGGPGDQWAVWRLGRDGGLIDTGERLRAGRATGGRVHFTPDGSLAMAAQEDGTIAVFAIDADGSVRVIDPGWDDEIYAGTLSMHPSGERAWLLNESWPESGGGAFSVAIDCETGALRRDTAQFVTKNASAMVHIGPDRAVVAGRLVAGGPPSDEVAVVDLATLSSVTTADPFGDDDAIMSDVAATPANGGLLVMAADNNLFSDRSNRVGVMTLRGDSLTVGSPVAVEDPVSIVASPFGDAVLVASGYGDTAVVFRIQDDLDTPLVAAGAPAWVGRDPSLPGSAVVVQGGPNDGLIVLAEVDGLRRLRFVGDGTVEDLGLVGFGGGLDAIPGAFGVQP